MKHVLKYQADISWRLIAMSVVVDAQSFNAKPLCATNLKWHRTSKQPTQGSIIIPIHLSALGGAAHLRHPENVLSSNATQGRIITLAVASSIAAARELTIHLRKKKHLMDSDWEMGMKWEGKEWEMDSIQIYKYVYIYYNIYIYIYILILFDHIQYTSIRKGWYENSLGKECKQEKYRKYTCTGLQGKQVWKVRILPINPKSISPEQL